MNIEEPVATAALDEKLDEPPANSARVAIRGLTVALFDFCCCWASLPELEAPIDKVEEEDPAAIDDDAADKLVETVTERVRCAAVALTPLLLPPMFALPVEAELPCLLATKIRCDGGRGQVWSRSSRRLW